jgi:hypothetical protein
VITNPVGCFYCSPDITGCHSTIDFFFSALEERPGNAAAGYSLFFFFEDIQLIIWIWKFLSRRLGEQLWARAD